MATHDQLDRIMAILMATYPKFCKDIDPERLSLTVEMYHRLLRDIDGQLLEAATLQHIAHNKWFPTIAELREAALALITHDESSAEEAWIEVKRVMRTLGSYGVPKWSNPKIGEAVSAFGWKDLCMTEIEQEGIVRAHFMRIYDSLKHRERDDHLMLPEARAAITTQRQIVADKIKQLAESKRA